MKTAGELLAVFFDKSLVEKAQGYSNLFSCWAEITEKNEIPSAAAHSRIVELERAVLLVEADHPGWIQILQTKQVQLLKTVIRRFPDLVIRGISFRLSRDPLSISAEAFASGSTDNEPEYSNLEVQPENGSEAVNKDVQISDPLPVQDDKRDYFSRIKDGDFLETLKRLEKLERRGRSRKKD
jgi:hypothetical protein